jgi:TPP-dependent pyruvate/acetoin dehydrogenase alpha subunit
MVVPLATTPSAAPSASDAIELYRKMLIIRRTEEQLARAHQQGLVHGACHTYVGEEAIAVGVCAHLTQTDAVFSTHRGHGHALAKGVPPRELIAELLGRVTGVSHGRGGSMHVFSPEVGMLGTSGIVGPSILMAAGVGYAFRLEKSERVSVAFFGDGASNNGAFHEGLNMAAIWKLPVLFVCENNQYATEVPFASVAGNSDVSARGPAYGMPTFAVDGNDVLAVYTVAEEAVRRARAGDGPTLLACSTYRTRAHSEGMRDGGYRTREEVEEWRTRDPIKRLRNHLVASGDAANAELDSIEHDIQALANDALEWAKASPYPDPSTVLDHVYADKPEVALGRADAHA